MAYSYGIKNTYRPSKLAPAAYAWSTHPGYNGADVPHALVDAPANITHDQFLQQFAYEWFESRDVSQGLTNPPFLSGAAGRLMPMLRNQDTGGPARILRGYIRRAGFEADKDISRARLYFMYNPEVIQRDYVSYLNQTALDPFNTVYGTANDVAPPSFMDFTFSIFFDRQEEAADSSHPGVFVDYQYFDLVVRNVIPQDPNVSNNTLPDNGVMMVNPKDVTVVFSPQITVQGRPLNASVRFEKFTHRMVPTRMWITLTIRVIYLGPVKDMFEYTAEELQAEEAIPLYESKRDIYQAPESSAENDDTGEDFLKDPSSLPLPTKAYLEKTYGLAQNGSDLVRKAALDWAYQHVDANTQYENDSRRANLPASADCSGLVGLAFRGVGVGDEIGWGGNWVPNTQAMHDRAVAPHNKYFLFISLTTDRNFNWKTDLLPGDILCRTGHVVFFVKYVYPAINDNLPKDPTGMRVFGAHGHDSHPEVGEKGEVNHGTFTDIIRVTNVGSSSAVAASTTWHENMSNTQQGPR